MAGKLQSADSYLRKNVMTSNEDSDNNVEKSITENVTPSIPLDGVSTYGLAASSQIPIAQANEIDADYCLNFLRAVRDCTFATVDENGLPSARVIDVMLAKNSKLFFLAPRGKAFYADIIRTGQVAIVAQTTDSRMCRLRGPVVYPQDPQEQQRLVDMLFDANPGMKELYPDDSRYVIDVFYIEEGDGEYFDLGQKPLVRVPFHLGAGSASEQGYLITKSCIGCGTCARKCPRGCISGKPGEIHVIDQQACLHCGLCYESCPHGAIEKRN